jgi:hypothetical protein
MMDLPDPLTLFALARLVEGASVLLAAGVGLRPRRRATRLGTALRRYRARHRRPGERTRRPTPRFPGDPQRRRTVRRRSRRGPDRRGPDRR